MADLLGALPLPIAIPQSGPQILDPTKVRVVDQPAADPLLYYLGTFIVAVANAKSGAAWSAISPANLAGPCQSLYFNDPNKLGLSTDDFPAMFLWEHGEPADEWWADSWHIQKRTLVLTWVLEPAETELQRRRLLLVWPTIRAIKAAVAEGRHPAWVVPGDSATLATTLGSPLWLRTGHMRLHSGEARQHDVQVEMVDPLPPGEKPPVFEAFELTFNVAERVTRDMTARYQPNGGLVVVTQSQPNDPLGPWPGPVNKQH